MMKCAVWTGADNVEVQERPVPEVSDDEILVSVAYAGICGSDMHILRGGLPVEVLAPPRILGHEFSGVVERVGRQVKAFKRGDRVVAHPNAPCGECTFCRMGAENHCIGQYSIITGPKGGAFAEYIVVKGRQTYHLPDHVPLKEAALVEPTAIALHCVDRAQIKPGERVVILGGGPIGLLCLQLARLAGASTLILSEPDQGRRHAGECMGADVVVDPLKEDLADIVREATAGMGVDVAIEAVGAPKVIEQGVELVRNGGRLMIVGWPPRTSTVNLHPYQIYRRELDIRGSYFSPYSFQRAINLIPRLDLAPFLTHCFRLAEAPQAFNAQKSRTGLKILICPHDD